MTAEEMPTRGLGTPSVGGAESHEPALREARNPVWVRMAIIGAALVLPLASAGIASTLLGDAIYEDEPVAGHAQGRGAMPGGGHGRHLSMRVGVGSVRCV